MNKVDIFKELKIHVRHIYLDEYSFVGLSSVHTLDVSNCNNLYVQDVLKTLKVKSASLPALKSLILSGIGMFSDTKKIRIIQKDVDYITQRKITTLDLSNLRISSIDISAILKMFNSPSFSLN
jgi:hypothetical protein